MTAPKSFAELWDSGFRSNRIEPEQRMVGGRFGYAFHRFPIKGGISARDVMLKNISASNALFRKFAKAQK